jgi:glycolate oxidase FAD binding subunit
MSRSVENSVSRLEEIAGGVNVATSAADLAAREVCGMRPSAVVRPADAVQVAEILRFAAAEKLAVIPCGSGTKLGIGSRPSRYDLALDLSRMNRVLSYDPQDLTLGVEPGVRIEDLLRALAEQKQFLPLAVPFLDRATIGGIVAANSSSPTRHAYGSVRDFCLGMEFVTGEGAQAKSGGRVVKNVTGYDLHKLLIGSLGTLAVITRVNFRTFPMAQAQETFVASFSSAESAFEFCRSVSQSVLLPQMMEIADPGAGRLIFLSDVAARSEARSWSVVLTASGLPAVVKRYARDLERLATTANAVEFSPLVESDATAILTRIREFPGLLLEASPSAAIFRISTLPGAMALLLGKLRDLAAMKGLEFAALTRASGILYVALLPAGKESGANAPLISAVPEVFRACGQPDVQASAILEWCPTEVKSANDGVWGPSRPDFELMRRVKHAFDPDNILAPGRFAGGF